MGYVQTGVIKPLLMSLRYSWQCKPNFEALPTITDGLSRSPSFGVRPTFAGRQGFGRRAAGKSARKIAATLNERQIATPTGSVWHAATVIRVQKRPQLGEG
jgi:hypothetical protein